VLIFGWVFGVELGVAGAAIATLVALVIADVSLLLYVLLARGYLRFEPTTWAPDLRTWRDILRIGLPAGAELAILGVYLVIVYGLLKRFGADAQGGFAIGARIGQSIILPATAVGLANAAIVGQNFGAGLRDRVRQSFWLASAFGVAMMSVIGIFCHTYASQIIGVFNNEPNVIAVGVDYLRLLAFTFVFTALIFSSASVFQGIGKTKPPLISATVRLVVFTVVAMMLTRYFHGSLHQLWIVAVTSIALQGVVSCLFVAREFHG
jgi:Na+-driven multidrug efflux pump